MVLLSHPLSRLLKRQGLFDNKVDGGTPNTVGKPATGHGKVVHGEREVASAVDAMVFAVGYFQQGRTTDSHFPEAASAQGVTFSHVITARTGCQFPGEINPADLGSSW